VNGLHWRKTAVGDWTAYADRRRYRVRRVNGFNPPAGPWFWVYVNGVRYTPTGHYEDAVSFPTAIKARRFAERLFTGRTTDVHATS